MGRISRCRRGGDRRRRLCLFARRLRQVETRANAALDRIITAHDAAIITTAGGIVANQETYALLLRRTHTIWIKARPEDHMSRVMAQGDFRPMAQNRAAMADLVAILEARRADYSRAEAEIDTSGEAIEQSFAKLLQTVTALLDGKS